MVIWQRWGILVFFAVLGGLALAFGVFQGLLPAEPAYTRASLTVAIGFFIAALLALGICLLRYFRVIDAPYPQTAPGEKLRRPPSSLFFIPIVAWPIILAAIGVLGLVVGLTGS